MSEPLSPNEKPIGEWNKVEVVSNGDKAEFYFNGMKTGEYWDISPLASHSTIERGAYCCN